MCLILDANIVHSVFPEPSECFKPIYAALFTGRAHIVYGGHLTVEYNEIAWFGRLLRVLDSQGRAKHVDDALVTAATTRVVGQGLYQSDDPHILGLAQVSKARLLCSRDKKLARDFKNKSIISNPRGSVYKRASHQGLIQIHCPDRRQRGRRRHSSNA